MTFDESDGIDRGRHDGSPLSAHVLAACSSTPGGRKKLTLQLQRKMDIPGNFEQAKMTPRMNWISSQASSTLL
ncbi:unnamed protein product [Nippostrongylus brasiliensis]|uniref:Uncharacterized protein n=1 Tax=Nippostrongylus brasiliensis TaxID=27835 RepID=A0A0N4XZS5_NIPBR|nr:unnamed protein product [Nippostrongylus brasiliensis]